MRDRQKAIYEMLQKNAVDRRCEIPLRDLAARIGCSVLTLRRDLQALVDQRWLLVEHGRRRRSVFYLRDPEKESEAAELERLKLQVENAPYTGEALLKAILGTVVDETDYVDNARPSFLINPLTGLPLEYDRFYPSHKVAIEFHGAQHFSPTDLFPSTASARRQRTRDLIKLGLSMENGVRVVVFRSEDLSVNGVMARLRGLLPLRTLKEEDPRLRWLDERCLRYRSREIPSLRPVRTHR